MTAPPDVTAVVVSWNTVDLLDECLVSLRDHGSPGRRMDVIVVDNSSSDGSAEMVRERWPDVRLVANTENVGFCRANNQAIALTGATYLLLINADARLTPGCLDHLLARMESDDRVGVVAPRLEYGDGRFQRWTAGRAPSLGSVASYLFLADRLDGRFPALAGTYLGHDTTVAFRPDWVSSACMLLRRAMVDDVGPLDEQIFVYMDDVELCQRARDGGWSVWYEPAATSVHLMGQSTKRRTGVASPEAMRAFNRYFCRRHGPARTTALRALQAGGFGLRFIAYGASGLILHDDRRRAQARAHLSHLKLSLETPEVAA
jgi:N-acetylglucosaminyl-diphospho-decaprenol L-rhamnosyltransferase